MKNRFTDKAGRPELVESLALQRMVGANMLMAEALADIVDVYDVNPGETIIEQLDETTDVFFVLVGEFDVLVNKRRVAICRERECVGEMAAIRPQPRSATVTAKVLSTVAKLTAEQLTALGSEFPDIYRHIARDLARRVSERNHLIPAVRDRARVFVICSTEALAVGRAITAAVEHDKFDVKLWTDGVFKVTNYTLEDLERELNTSDFAIAIAHPDDKLTWREEDWPAPRDNVVLELGMFIGRLGRNRAILMEPRGTKVKLPSDMAGITTVGYKLASGSEIDSALAPAIEKVRRHIESVGVIR
ncbi:TIR domain-containing protein [Cupriavidus sp. UYPR2.512]|uniref:TIR domain-containing protein n=1 Tax=Cupriavidus sp. UYPR2.512 TaxID=1080187 RepID=UPI00036CA2A2|nr:TIR domain-containing protein [Cupriavidus sp. UYPR2.512]UIF88020.1 nucleotide-binding protein [Cupriavidus necator]